MQELLPPWPLLAAFLTSSLLLAVSPGPGVLYIVTRSLAQGRRCGLVSVAGIALGNLCNACAAALGLAALFAVSSLAFSVVKYAGAVYLLYLGLKALRAPRNTGEAARSVPCEPRRVFRDGIIVALLNPKTTLFYAAFLPQFMRLDASPMMQGVILGILFVAVAAITDSLYAIAAGSRASLLQRRSWARSGGRYLSAATFFGLGLFAAFGGTRRAA